MANRFWVGGGSANTWAATVNTNWATSSGGANNASVPTTTDVAIFDSNSGVGNSVIGASTTVQGLDCTGGTGNYAGTITHNTAVTLTINTGAASSLRFSAGMTYTPATTTSLITFTHTTGTASVTSNGQKLAALTINGVGGTTQLVDALLVNAVAGALLTLTNGVLDAATNTAAMTVILFTSNNSNTRTLSLGGTVTLGGNTVANNNIWNFTSTTNLTFNKNSANLIVLAPQSSIVGLIMALGSLTYNDLTLNATSNSTGLALSGAATLAHFVINSGWQIQFPSNATLTISNAFTWTGTQANPIAFTNTTFTQTTTISCPSGACTLKWGYLSGVVGTGGATFTATDTLNGGNNTNWSISPPADSALTPAGIATAVWEDLLAGGDFGTAGSIGALLNQVDANGFMKVDTADVGGQTATAAGGVTFPSSIASNPAAITSNIKKNTASNGYMIVMTDATTHLPKTGLTVTSQVSLDGAAFGATANSVTEVSNGVYTLNLAAADVNGNHAMLLFTSAGADNLYTEIVTQP